MHNEADLVGYTRFTLSIRYNHMVSILLYLSKRSILSLLLFTSSIRVLYHDNMREALLPIYILHSNEEDETRAIHDTGAGTFAI